MCAGSIGLGQRVRQIDGRRAAESLASRHAKPPGINRPIYANGVETLGNNLKQYRVLADYRDARQAIYRGPREDFGAAADRCTNVSINEHATLRGVYIERCEDGVIVFTISKPNY